MPTSRTRRVLTALVLVVVVLLGAAIAVAVRSSTESARSGVEGTTLLAPEAGTDAAQAPSAQSPGAADAAGEAKIVRTATLSLTVASVDQGATGVRQVALDVGGQVVDERVVAGPSAGGRTTPTTPPESVPSATVRIEVPADQLDTALQRLSALGTVEQRTATARDVTTTYVDTEARIASKRASIERVRALMAQATAITQIVELEGQLAQRESELESLERTLMALQRKVAMSTVTVTLSTEATPAATGGFTDGLRDGWDALLTSLAVCLTVLGAVLPFAVALAVVALPVVVWWRRRSPDAGKPPAAEPEPVAAGGTGAPGGS